MWFIFDFTWIYCIFYGFSGIFFRFNRISHDLPIGVVDPRRCCLGRAPLWNDVPDPYLFLYPFSFSLYLGSIQDMGIWGWSSDDLGTIWGWSTTFSIRRSKGRFGGIRFRTDSGPAGIHRKSISTSPPKSSSGLRVMIWGEMAIQAQSASGMMYWSF